MRPALLLPAILLLATSCAGAGARPASPCGQAWEQATTLLRTGLEDYLAGMRRYAAQRGGADTAPAEARTRRAAGEWEKRWGEPFDRACRAWPEETRACVAAAGSAPGLGDCGPDPAALLTSFTDEVVSTFLASPLR